LARNILQGHGRLTKAGEHVAWTFLLRTREPVEEGIRRLLQDNLGPRWQVAKQGRQVTGASMTFNPDLVFNKGLATGDVKDKISAKDWSRTRLYQAIAFATIYRTNHAAVIGFTRPGSQAPPPVAVGNIELRHIDWPAAPERTATGAAESLADEVRQWLSHVDLRGPAAVS
jgi:hypothetical protein